MWVWYAEGWSQGLIVEVEKEDGFNDGFWVRALRPTGRGGLLDGSVRRSRTDLLYRIV